MPVEMMRCDEKPKLRLPNMISPASRPDLAIPSQVNAFTSRIRIDCEIIDEEDQTEHSVATKPRESRKHSPITAVKSFNVAKISPTTESRPSLGQSSQKHSNRLSLNPLGCPKLRLFLDNRHPSPKNFDYCP